MSVIRSLADPCVDWCQYAKDVGADTHSCGGQFCDHYAVRNASEEMLRSDCWLHGSTLWRLALDTLWWQCPLIDECGSKLEDEKVYKRKLPLTIVPPLFGFSRPLS